MDTEIADYEKAYQKLKEAEKRLGDKVGPAIASAKGRDDLFALVDRLPRSYPGTRRVFEAIERLVD